MKISRAKHRVKGREYETFKATLPRVEAEKLLKISDTWNLYDADPKGYADLRAPSKAFEGATVEPVRTSIRFHGSREEWAAFKDLCRSHGTTICHVISDLVQSCLEQNDHVLEAKNIQIVNVFTGSPRGHGEELQHRQPGLV